MKYIFPSLLLIASSVLAQPVGHVTTYQPPAFADADRVKKLEAAFPIVEKLYRERAEKYHYPGLAFGIGWEVGLFGWVWLYRRSEKDPGNAQIAVSNCVDDQKPDGDGYSQAS